MEGFSTWFKHSRRCKCLMVTGICVVINFRAVAVPVDFGSQGATAPGTFGVNSTDSLVMVVDGMTVTLSGGALLSHVSDLPADQGTVYGATSYVGAMNNPLTITFSAPVDDLGFTLYNGQTANTVYAATENGVSQQFSLAPNIFRGSTQISLAGTASEVYISDVSGSGTWDFFIDNLQFNPAATPFNVPDGGSALWLLALGLVALRLLRFRETLSPGNSARRFKHAGESFVR
jgi:hypothetical protein